MSFLNNAAKLRMERLKKQREERRERRLDELSLRDYIPGYDDGEWAPTSKI